MLTRVITLRFNGVLDGFDDAPLRDFIKDKEVISVHDHFFVRNDQPYLAVVVNYTLKPVATEAVATKPGQELKRRDETWREYVAEADVPLFNMLRDWRAERSKRDGVPPYVIIACSLFVSRSRARSAPPIFATALFTMPSAMRSIRSSSGG